VIHLDATLGQELLDVPIGQPVAQLPADREGDQLGRELGAAERGPLDRRPRDSVSTHRHSAPAPRASLFQRRFVEGIATTGIK
jgi:hypothetical protein